MKGHVMKSIVRILLTLTALLLAAAPASATQVNLRTSGGTSIDAGQTITDMFQSFVLPKFSASGSGQLTEHMQIQYIVNGGGYSFVYFQLDKVCVLVVGHPCVMKYKVEVSYQIHDSSGLHDGFLSDYGYPGDYVGWWYDETGGNGAYAEITNSGDSGQGSSWDHWGTWTWSGAHPNSYQDPFFTFAIDNFGFGHNCAGDMPAQDVAHSSSHVSTLDYLGVITLADTTEMSLPLGVVSPPVTSVSPTSCSIAIGTFFDGVYTNYEMTSYGGG